MPTRKQQGSEPQWLLLLTSYTILCKPKSPRIPRWRRSCQEVSPLLRIEQNLLVLGVGGGQLCSKAVTSGEMILLQWKARNPRIHLGELIGLDGFKKTKKEHTIG